MLGFRSEIDQANSLIMRMLLCSFQLLEDLLSVIRPGAIRRLQEEQNAFLRDERYSESCGISLSFRSNPQGRGPEIDGRTFSARGPTCRGAAPPFQRPIAPTSDIPPMEFSPDERGGCEKLKSHQRAIIVSPGVVGHPAKVKQFAGPYTDDVTFPLFRSRLVSLSSPLDFSFSVYLLSHPRPSCSFCRHCGGFSWAHVSPGAALA